MPVISNSTGTKGDVDHRGDLFATVKVKLPAEFTEEEIEIFRQLRAKRTGVEPPPDPPNAEKTGAEDSSEESRADKE